jgi:hypothetical protein
MGKRFNEIDFVLYCKYININWRKL